MSLACQIRVVLGALAISLVATGSASAGTGEQQPPTIAIIIDDMGHDPVQGERLTELDQPLTLAFLPYRRYTRTLAEAAHARGKEIMLHAPMANTRNYALGPGGLTPEMNQLTTTTTLRRALQSIPYVQGVNNHMGSLLTQQRNNMDWIMSELVQYPLYFVDSRTIASTVAADSAETHRVPNLTRDVFLDHEQTEAFVDRQFKLLIETAKRNGTAIGIGHPHKVTVDYLEKNLPLLDAQGIAVATVSGLWAMRHDNAPMFVEIKRPVVAPLAKRKTDGE
ncbi:divergent polysaccharide deacetylase family protein [Marinobacter fonticola]|uniref:divergent polysaccharide deacetylase family protein n=1 Tax=Marinobacter fonticola TaxID=2603215 RepID=UPI001D0DA8A5|nr:divergent polysaccharide deacetylase family protein [Marinobacter fonticola]